MLQKIVKTSILLKKYGISLAEQGKIPLLAAFIAIIPLFASYFTEFVISLLPCRLCLLQRYAYLALLFVACGGHIWQYLQHRLGKVAINKAFMRFFLFLSLSCLAYSMGVALLQLATNMGWVALDLCTSGLNAANTIDLASTLAYIQNQIAVPCAKSLPTTLMAGGNVLYGAGGGYLLYRSYRILR